MKEAVPTPGPENDVPLFGRWRNAYLTVAAIVVIEVAILYLVGRVFL